MQRERITRPILLEPRQRVRANWPGGKEGIVLRVGPEVSEVKWNDGQVQCVPNQHLQEN